MKFVSEEEFKNFTGAKSCIERVKIAREQIIGQFTMASNHEAILLFLSEMICERKGDCTLLEIGTFNGLNSRLLVTANKNLSIVTMDILPIDKRNIGIYGDLKGHSAKAWAKDHYSARLRNVDHPRIKYIEKSSTSLNEVMLLRGLGTIDIFWIDGDHGYPQIALDAGAAITSLSLNRNQVTVLDDVHNTNENPSYQVITRMCQDYGLSCYMIPKRANTHPTKYVAVLGFGGIFG